MYKNTVANIVFTPGSFVTYNWSKNMEYNFEIDNSYSTKSIEITGTLNQIDLEEIEKIISSEKIDYISFDYEQDEKTWKEINKFIEKYNPKLRISLDYDEMELNNLSFLKYLTSLQELLIFYFRGYDLSPISNLSKLKVLKFFHPFVSKKARIKPLINLHNIEELAIYDIKDLEEISNFKNLKSIDLNSIKLENLNFLKLLKRLEEITLRSSEKITDFSGLYNLPNLKSAFIFKNYKNTTAEFLSNLEHLEKLEITDFNSLEKFPSLEKLKKLKYLSIVNMKILSDIQGVVKAENLEELHLFVGKKFKPQALTVLKNHKKIKNISAGFDTKKDDEEGKILISEILNKNYR